MNPTRKEAIEELRRMVLGALAGHSAAAWPFRFSADQRCQNPACRPGEIVACF